MQSAVSGENFDIIKFLCQHINEKNPQNEDGTSVLHLAVIYGRYDILKFIGDQVEEKNPVDNVSVTILHQAAKNGDLRSIKYIISNTRKQNLQTFDCRSTSLHWAFLEGKLEANKYLIEIDGCDSKIKNRDGKTPLDLAIASGRRELANYLK